MTPKILVFDIETAPLTVYTWTLWDEHVGLNQIKKDWYILAFAAKWLGEPKSKVIYRDNRHSGDDDKAIVSELAMLINQADIVVTQNGDKFDIKKLNARALINDLPPIKPVRSTDILKEGRKVFSFASHKLAYVTDKLNKVYKKLDHSEYPGFELWKAIMAGDKRAWPIMQKYCIYDVMATEETYLKIQGWIKTQNVASFSDDAVMRCKCGKSNLMSRGYAYTDTGKYQQYLCRDCGKWPRSGVNLLVKEKRDTLLKGR